LASLAPSCPSERSAEIWHRSPYSLPFRARESKRRQSGGVPIDLRDLLAPAGRRCDCWPPAAFSV
jgi:hypothetical protein